MPEESDLALETLLAVRAETAPALSEQLLRRCYAIQKSHQFSTERAQSANAMLRLIDEQVTALMTSATREGTNQ